MYKDVVAKVAMGFLIPLLLVGIQASFSYVDQCALAPLYSWGLLVLAGASLGVGAWLTVRRDS